MLISVYLIKSVFICFKTDCLINAVYYLTFVYILLVINSFIAHIIHLIIHYNNISRARFSLGFKVVGYFRNYLNSFKSIWINLASLFPILSGSISSLTKVSWVPVFYMVWLPPIWSRQLSSWVTGYTRPDCRDFLASEVLTTETIVEDLQMRAGTTTIIYI